MADAVKSGVLENTSGKQFKAGGTVTLEEFSGMLVRYLSSVKKFNDVALENPVLTVRATLDADASMARDAALTRAQAVCLVFAATRATAWPQAEPAFDDLDGLTDAARSLICVDVHGNVLTRDSTTILHELGHFVQHNAPAWLDGALNAAYAAERDALASVLGRSDCKKSADEFFAEAYRAYRLGKCDETRTPLTCAMLDRLAADGWVAGK